MKTKSIICYLLLMFCMITSYANDYYISTLGNDNNNGTIESPLLSFDKANELMVAGDVCYIREGIYRQTLTITKDNIEFRNYNNEEVTISGCDVVDNWTAMGNNTYRSPILSEVHQLFVDGNRANIASYPDVVDEYFVIDNWANTHTDIIDGDKQIVVFDDDTFENGDKEISPYTLKFSEDFSAALLDTVWANHSAWTHDIPNSYITRNSANTLLLQATTSTNHRAEMVFSPEAADHANVIGDATKEGRSPIMGLMVRASDAKNGYVIRIQPDMPDDNGEFNVNIMALKMINGSTANNQIETSFSTGKKFKIGSKYRMAVDIVGYTLQVYLSKDGEELENICSFTDGDKTYANGVHTGIYLFNYSKMNVYAYNLYSIANLSNGWNGAYYLGVNSGTLTSISNPFRCARGQVESTENNVLTLGSSNVTKMMSGKSTGGYGKGLLLKHMDALTSANEWHFQNDSLYYITDGVEPSTLLLEARTRLYAVNMNNVSNVALVGINIKAGSISMENAVNCLVDSCKIRYISPFSAYINHDWGEVSDASRGVYVSGSNNMISNSYFGASWSACVTLDGEYNTINNCLLEDANWLGSRLGALSVHGDYCNVSYNTIRHTTRDGIEAGNGAWIRKIGTDITINNNFIYSTNIRHPDGGCFYSNHQKENLNKIRANTVLINNWLKVGSKKYGITHKKYTGAFYPDNYSSGYIAKHNLMVTSKYAIKSNAFDTASYDNHYFNNTVYDVSATGTGTGYGCFEEVSNNFSNKSVNPTSKYDYLTIVKRNNAKYDNAEDEFENVNFWDFRLKKNSMAIDAGIQISGVTSSTSPDIGCYESTSAAWVAGCSFDTPIFSDEPSYSSEFYAPELDDVVAGNDENVITWTDKATDNEACAIERHLVEGDWERIGTVLSGVESFTDSLTASDQTVEYRVRNIKGDRFSTISNILKIIPRSTLLNTSKAGYNLKFYPNPVYDIFTISTDKEIPLSITITDLTGQCLLVEETKAQTHTININNLSTGMYVVYVNGLSHKIVKH